MEINSSREGRSLEREERRDRGKNG